MCDDTGVNRMARLAYEAWLRTARRLNLPGRNGATWAALTDQEKAGWLDAAIAAVTEAARQREAGQAPG